MFSVCVCVCARAGSFFLLNPRHFKRNHKIHVLACSNKIPIKLYALSRPVRCVSPCLVHLTRQHGCAFVSFVCELFFSCSHVRSAWPGLAWPGSLTHMQICHSFFRVCMQCDARQFRCVLSSVSVVFCAHIRLFRFFAFVFIARADRFRLAVLPMWSRHLIYILLNLWVALVLGHWFVVL